MTLALVALALALAGGVVTIAWLARKLESALHGQTVAGKSALDYERLWNEEKRVAEGYIAQRNANAVRAAELESLNTGLKMRVASLQTEVNDAKRKVTAQIVERLRAANVADAAKIVDELLSVPLFERVSNTEASDGTGVKIEKPGDVSVAVPTGPKP